MRNPNPVFIILVFVLASCASTQTTPAISDSERDGTSIEKAIVVKSIPEEYQWVKTSYPGGQVTSQTLLERKHKYYDRLGVTLSDGKKIEVYFDINSFYGKW